MLHVVASDGGRVFDDGRLKGLPVKKRLLLLRLFVAPLALKHSAAEAAVVDYLTGRG